MTINKFQRSMLTFDLSAKSVILESHQYKKNIVFSQTIGSIELKIRVKTPYDTLAKIYTKHFGHMTKMTTMPIYGKKTFKIFFSRTRRQVTLGLGM